jgi:hypothetical protein
MTEEIEHIRRMANAQTLATNDVFQYALTAFVKQGLDKERAVLAINEAARMMAEAFKETKGHKGGVVVNFSGPCLAEVSGNESFIPRQ